MAALLVQLSDIHFESESDALLDKSQQLFDAVVAEIDASVTDVAIIFSGDVTWSGTRQQFGVAEQFVRELTAYIESVKPNVRQNLLIVPGNHDCDFSGDQGARDGLLSSATGAKIPSPSVSSVILKPLENFFEFIDRLQATSGAISRANPFFATAEISVAGDVIQFNLFNTAWMSIRREAPGTLSFPLDALKAADGHERKYVISVLHHPFNWFKQPEVMRLLRDWVQRHSDMVMTGHEHVESAYQKAFAGGSTHGYIEGGVLQERGDAALATFHIIRIDISASTQKISTYRWSPTGYFGLHDEPNDTPLAKNRGRAGIAFYLKRAFEEYLEDPELAIAHARHENLRLSNFYTYPDLRDIGDFSDSENWQRLKAQDIVETVAGSSAVLITGASRSGKTSLAKALFRDLYAKELLPILLNGADVCAATDDRSVRKAIARAIKDQYEAIAPERYEQQPRSRRVMILDDLEKGPEDREVRNAILEAITSQFAVVVAITSDDFGFEELHGNAVTTTPLKGFKRLSICEFGHLRLEELATRWLRLHPIREERTHNRGESQVRRVCREVERALRTSAIPHHPWILLVLLQQIESTDHIAAKNGSYGHLYNAVITFALHESRFKRLDIKGKYTYLGRLAYSLYRRESASIGDEALRAFHRDHCEAFDIDLDFEALRDDLVHTGMLRFDEGQVAFRAKFTYCFFLAWHVSQHIHEMEFRDLVGKFARRLHHEESANAIIFLAHLCNDPIVLSEMTMTAEGLFKDDRAIELESDVEFLDGMIGQSITLELPPTSPEENRQARMDDEDEADASSETTSRDGRTVTARPNDAGTELVKLFQEHRAARNTIEILGQVVRNEAGAIGGDEKQRIVHEVFRLGRRMFGRMAGMIQVNLPQAVNLMMDVLRKPADAGGKQPYRRAQESEEQLRNRAERALFGMSVLFCLQSINDVSEAVGMELLSSTFRRVVEGDDCVANKILDLAIALDFPGTIPRDKVAAVHESVRRAYFPETVLRFLVLDYLYLYNVPQSDKQAICAILSIDPPRRAFDPSAKKHK